MKNITRMVVLNSNFMDLEIWNHASNIGLSIAVKRHLAKEECES